jgi:hypothetical protein
MVVAASLPWVVARASVEGGMATFSWVALVALLLLLLLGTSVPALGVMVPVEDAGVVILGRWAASGSSA